MEARGTFESLTITNATNPSHDHIATHIGRPTPRGDPATTPFWNPTTLAARAQSHLYRERFRPDQHRAADRVVIPVWLRSNLVYPQAPLSGLGATPDDDPTGPSLELPLSTILQKSNFQQSCVLLSS
jgi:hypothetical protein